MDNNPKPAPSPVDFSKVSLSLGGGAGRPMGVSLISIYYILSALFALLALLVSQVLISQMRSVTSIEVPGSLAGYDFFTRMIEDQQRQTQTLLTILSIAVVLLAALNLAIGFGLWRLRIWAYYLALVFSCIGLVSNLCGGIFRAGAVTLSEIIGVALNVLIVLYLLRPQTREAFAG